MNIDLYADTTEVLINPRLPEIEQQKIKQALTAFDLVGHLWFATSGSTAKANQLGKWVALSKSAVLASAKAVNAHLACNAKDIWLNPLPHFHVGGMGINARAQLAGAQVIDFLALCPKWEPLLCYQTLIETKATLTALVSTQLYDFVRLNLPAPATLRAIIIGGGALQPSLYFKAVSLGWNILPSYGLTECGSQVATARLNSLSLDTFPSLYVLPHLQASITHNGLIRLKGESLLTTYAIDSGTGLQLHDPKVDGWLETEDRGELSQPAKNAAVIFAQSLNQALQIFGRTESFIKIGGESVEMKRLEAILDEIKLELKIECDIALIAYPDERLGHVVQLVATEGSDSVYELMARYNETVLPFEKIRQLHVADEIPRTSLNKLRREGVLQLIKSRTACARN